VATIRPYISQGAQASQQVELKIHEVFWRTVGHGSANVPSEFEITIGGSVELLVFHGDLQIHIALLDQDEAAMEGPCLLEINTLLDENARYRIQGDALAISAMFEGKDMRVELSRSKQNDMTKCKLSGHLNLTVYVEKVASSDR
jgi:hypothetical protein